MRFEGYSQNPKGYCLLDEDGKKIVVKCDVTFNETDFAIKEIETELTTEKETMVVDPILKKDDKVQDESPQQPQREKRERRPPVRYGRDEYADIATIENHHMAYNAGLITETKSLNEAPTTDYEKEGEMVADLEYKSLMENETWKLVELPWDEVKLNAGGCLKSNEEVMEMLNVSKDAWWPRDMPRNLELTMMKPFHQSYVFPLSEH